MESMLLLTLEVGDSFKIGLYNITTSLYTKYDA